MRGWSRLRDLRKDRHQVVPARGGGPCLLAKVPLAFQWSPRVRGGPVHDVFVPAVGVWSPHVRGWSLPQHAVGVQGAVVPAPAGVVPRTASRCSRRSCGPARAGVDPGRWADRSLPRGGPRACGGSLRIGDVLVVREMAPARAGFRPRPRPVAFRTPNQPTPPHPQSPTPGNQPHPPPRIPHRAAHRTPAHPGTLPPGHHPRIR